MRRLILAVAIVALFASPAYAEVILVTTGDEVGISWTASTEADLTGYNIYTRQALADEPTLLGTVTITEYLIRVADLFEGINYISLTAFDKVKNESGQSVPAVDQIGKDTIAPEPPVNVIIWKVE